MQMDLETVSLEKIEKELHEGMLLAKCRKCGCMKEALDALSNSLTVFENDTEAGFANILPQWKSQIEPIKYACLGCEFCFPAVALNELSKVFPDAAPSDSLSCAFWESIPSGEAKERPWPPMPGEYKVLCDVEDSACGNEKCRVAISTLASPELVDRIAALNPEEVCIVGKTEMENIGVDKLIKNTITNKAIRFLVLAGTDPKGHKPGQTILSLSSNGVDEKMRVIGSEGKRPFLRNVTRDEIELFRKQVEVIDMIGCEDVTTILDKTRGLLVTANTSEQQMEQPKIKSGCSNCSDRVEMGESMEVPTIQAKEPSRIQMDMAGYFVIVPLPGKGIISVEHYSYDDKLLRTIEGKDARSLYWTIIGNKWVTQLSHAAYLGKELEKAELALKYGLKYSQDGA